MESVVKTVKTDNCTGCGACVCTCPQGALSFGKDAWGYYVPVIDESKCNNCGLCSKTCPVAEKKPSSNAPEKVKAFCFVSDDDELLMTSSSGAAFSHLANEILDMHGTVYGAAWNDGNTVSHIAVSEKNDLTKLQRSKYMQSYTGDIFKEVKKDLEGAVAVLFTGCPCQIAGLMSYLGKEYDDLYTVDLFCANAPSPDFFKSYLNDEFDGDVATYEFRDKTNGWRCDCEKVVTGSGQTIIHTGEEEDSYQSIFHDHTMCPVHCEKCMFHEIPRYGDISIGDFWGVSSHMPGADTQKGASIVLVNNEKGMRLFEKISSTPAKICKEVPVEWIGSNGYLGKGSQNFVSQFRDMFYELYKEKGFRAAVNAVNMKKTGHIKNRFFGDFILLKKWISHIQNGEKISDLFTDKGYRQIAVYGLGDIGKLLVKELENSDVTVKYVIDRNPRSDGSGLKVYGADEPSYPMADAVIVTILWDIENIRNRLQNKTGCVIVSLQDMI